MLDADCALATAVGSGGGGALLDFFPTYFAPNTVRVEATSRPLFGKEAADDCVLVPEAKTNAPFSFETKVVQKPAGTRRRLRCDSGNALTS